MKKKLIKGLLPIVILGISTLATNAQRHGHHKNEHNHAPRYHYAKLPHWGASYKVAPKKAIVLAHHGIDYRFYNGIFYKPFNGNYIIAKAPIGIRIKTLPKEKIRFILHGKPYFYYYGTFFVASDDGDGYTTVEAPIGAKVDALPEGYNQIEKNGEIFYKFEDNYYKQITENNEEWFEVVNIK